MNEIFNNFMFGPLGWKVVCGVVTLVGILLAIALMDGPWVRGKEKAKPPLPQQDDGGPPAGSSSKLSEDNRSIGASSDE